MSQLFETTSYIGLLFVSIISGTFLPGPSDFAIFGMFTLDFTPWVVIAVATLGIMIARVINYYVGTLGEEYVVQKKGWLTPLQVARAKNIFSKYGDAAMLMTWIPLVDDPLTIVGGFFRINFARYILFTFIASLFRHYLLYLLFRSVFMG